MSQRGTKAVKENRWRRGQRRLGRMHARLGKPAIYANEHYQRGYREGLESPR